MVNYQKLVPFPFYFFLALSGCASSVEVPQTTVFATSNVAARKALVQRLYLDGYLGGNLATIDSVFASEYVRHDSGVTGRGGREDQHRLAKNLRTAFPDLQARVDFMIAEGDTVAARWTMWGTATGPGPWGPPTGKTFRFSGINIFRFENGQVTEIWNHRDDLAWFRQLGILPPAGTSR